MKDQQPPNIMEVTMKDQLIRSLLAHAHGELEYHKANVKVYLNNPVGIGEHPDVMGAITDELDKIAKYHDQVEVIERYFK
jgi:methyl coenzyme M reductase gamma subunit